MPRSRWICPLLVAIVSAITLALLTACHKHTGAIHSPQPTVAAREPAGQEYPDSAAGIQAQFAEIVRVARSNDQRAFHALLDSLSVPDTEKWITSHFDPRFESQLQQDYASSLGRYQSHVTWVMENFAKFADFALTTELLETAAPPGDSGFESLLPRPNREIKIENYRLSSTSPDSEHGPPSWVSCFTYIGGRFRYIGGTYPFWAEKLAALRGPMSMPPAVIHGRTVQGMAFQHDQPGGEIDAIVQLKIEIDRGGQVRNIEPISGDAPSIEDAIAYVRQADFGVLPDIPQLPNAKRVWELEVAFFTPKK